LHVTLRFFGQADEAQVEALRALTLELGAMAMAGTGVDVRASAVTGFPSAKRAHVLVVELVDDGTLASLAARSEAAAVALGFAPERRAYDAHLTLARMRMAADVSSLAGEAATLPAGRVTAITLYASTTTPTGPVYVPLERATVSEP
jgi:2'-5' RNA ligase